MKFACYDLEMSVPNDWRLGIDKKSGYASGTLSFTTPAGMTVEAVWEDLERHSQKYPTVEAFMNSYFEMMRTDRHVKDFRVDDARPIVEGGHESYPHEITFTYKRGLGKTVSQKMVGIAIYCRPSNRFIIVYSRIDPDKPNDDEMAVRDSLKSFECTNRDAKL